jgi:hypothetical protein
MNGSNIRLAASLIEDRHRDAAAARRAGAAETEGGVQPSVFHRLAAIRTLPRRAGKSLALRRSSLRTEH